MDSVYHRRSSCAETGQGNTTNEYCRKCIHHGVVDKSNVLESRWIVESPCVVCAMANGGFWGWVEGHYGEEEYRLPDNGVLPGHCGVQDALNNVGLSKNCHRTLNEQVILGFTQYALYNHLKWSDIISSGSSRTRPQRNRDLGPYRRNYCPEDTSDIEEETDIDNVWYWWKLIPKETVLPERLFKILLKILVEYPDKQHEGCIPKTRQKLGGILSGDIWTDFLDTYVEPSHVSHIFMYTMGKVLDYDDEVEHDTVLLSRDDVSAESSRNGIEDIWWMRNVLTSSASHIDHAVQFMLYKDVDYTITEGREGRLKIKVVRIFDRDIFGCYLEDVIDYDWLRERSWNRRENIFWPYPNITEENGLDRRPIGWQSELWNTGESVLINFRADVMDMVAYEETDFWEDVRQICDDYIEWDYTNEMCFRTYMEEDHEDERPTGDDNTVVGDNEFHDTDFVVDRVGINLPDGFDEVDTFERQLDFAPEEMEEYEPGEISRNNNSSEKKLKDVVEKLKELQVFVDDSVKEIVTEGVYLELVNKLLDVYRSAK
jgi:hypothetical protein